MKFEPKVVSEVEKKIVMTRLGRELRQERSFGSISIRKIGKGRGEC